MFSFSELSLRAVSYSVSVPPPCYRSGTYKTPAILPKVHILQYACTLDRTKSEWAECAVQAWCGNRAGKRAQTQFVREYSATVVLAR